MTFLTILSLKTFKGMKKFPITLVFSGMLSHLIVPELYFFNN